MAKKIRASKEKNETYYWFRRTVIQDDEDLCKRGRMLMQMALLQPYRMEAVTQAKGFGASVDTAWRVRRSAVKAFPYKGVRAALFEKRGKEYLKTEVADWNNRFNACPDIKDLYFKLVTLRIDLAFGMDDNTARASARELADMMGADPKSVGQVLRVNKAKDETVFDIERYAGGRHSYHPKLERVSHLCTKTVVVKPDRHKPDKQWARYILETQFDIHGPKAKRFIENYVVPAQQLGLDSTYEKLVKAVAKLYHDLIEQRRASGCSGRAYGAGEIMLMYFDHISELERSLPPTTDVLNIKTSGWFRQFIKIQSGREQVNIITGAPVW